MKILTYIYFIAISIAFLIPLDSNTVRDIIAEDGQIIVGGWASSSSQAQVAATWVNGQLVYLEDKDIYSVINSISID